MKVAPLRVRVGLALALGTSLFASCAPSERGEAEIRPSEVPVVPQGRAPTAEGSAPPGAPDPGPRTRRLSVGDHTVAVLETAGSEPGARLPVVLLHGARFTKETWRELGTLDGVLGDRRVLAVDWPGSGASPGPAPREAAGFLRQLFEELDLDRPVLVAPSRAGCALAALLGSPTALSGAIAVAPACGEDFPPDSPVPARVLWGTADRVLPFERAADLAARFRAGRVEAFPGASHPCYLDDPDRFHRVVREFLESLESG